MTFAAAWRTFWTEFLGSLPTVAPRLALAWLVTFILLIYGFKWLKRHVRPVLLRWDDQIRYWALGLRYRVRGEMDTERHLRTWFFRFWTNFASAPSLSVISLGLAIFMVAQQGAQGRLFFLPGLCFASSMLMSFVSKRIFKRLRPVRDKGAFGHKLKDGSFPSGHSLTSLCFWMVLGACAFAGALAWAPLITLGGLAVVVLTGLSRVYLGVHFPSDVLGGYTIGLIWSVVCYFVLRGAL